MQSPMSPSFGWQQSSPSPLSSRVSFRRLSSTPQHTTLSDAGFLLQEAELKEKLLGCRRDLEKTPDFSPASGIQGLDSMAKEIRTEKNVD